MISKLLSSFPAVTFAVIASSYVLASDEDVTAEFAKTGVEDPAALQDEWLHNGQLHLVRQGVLRAKAVENLMDSAVVTEVEDMTESDKKETKKGSKKAKQDKEAESEEK